MLSHHTLFKLKFSSYTVLIWIILTYTWKNQASLVSWDKKERSLGKTKRYRRDQSLFAWGRQHNQRSCDVGCRDTQSQEEVDPGRREHSAAEEVKIKRVVPQDKVKVRVRIAIGGKSLICINSVLHPLWVRGFDFFWWNWRLRGNSTRDWSKGH